jgi:hypothetical protein
MSQSGFIAAMLLAAFVLWLAINDRLTAYTAVLFGPTQQPTPQGNISNTNGIIGPSPTAGTGGVATPSLPGGSNLPSLGDSSNILDSVVADVPLLLELLP